MELQLATLWTLSFDLKFLSMVTVTALNSVLHTGFTNFLSPFAAPFCQSLCPYVPCTTLISSQPAALYLHHLFVSLREYSLLRPRFQVCAARRPDSARAPRLKDLPKKRLRDLSQTTGPSGVKKPVPFQYISEKLSEEEELNLNYDQAIGQIVSAQANFMRVIVWRAGAGERSSTAHRTVNVEHICQQGNLSQTDLQLLNNATGGFSLEARENVDEMPGFCNAEHTDKERKVGRELLCVVRALLKKVKRKVMVGDKVMVSGIDWTEGRGMIDEIFDRESEIVDPPVSNVDQLLVLFSMDRPRIEVMTLSRFLIEAESTGISFTLVFNKSDLASPKEIAEWEDRLLLWGYKPLFCSVSTKFGIIPLVNILSNKTSVIVGPSGVGKSSLINVLRDQVGVKSWSKSLVHDCEDEFSRQSDSNRAEEWSRGFEEQMVGEVSDRSGRGKHTTRNVTLLRLPSGGYLADTPGFNQPGLVKVTTKSLAHLFPEIRSKISGGSSCAFSDCLHIGEPDCVVGGDWERYAHYLQLLEDLKKREKIELKTFGTKRESEMRYKVKALGVKQPEPRLVLKTHRRISRHEVKQQLATEVAEEVEELEDA